MKVYIQITMSISNYKPLEPPTSINNTIIQLFRNRVHKKIPVDKTDFSSLPSLELNSLRRQYSQISQRSTFTEPQETQEKVLMESSVKIEPQIKKKMIRKHLRRAQGLEFSRQIHNKYTRYLVNYMHKTNLNLIRRGIPPNLSVLETIDEGDFLLNDNGTLYDRKDHPHYSNAIKLHQMPSDKAESIFINPPRKMRPEQLVFQIEDKCVLKLKHIIHFVSSLFRRSIQFTKKMKSIKYSSTEPRESQNHDFQAIAKEVNLHFRTTKLLYDILNEFYGFEREMIKGEQGKIKASKEIRDSLNKLLEKHKVNEAIHVPHCELFISLRQLRQILHAQVIAHDEEESD